MTVEWFTSHAAALEASLETAPHLPRDQATIHVARRISARLDEIEDQISEIEAEEAKGMIALENVRDRLLKSYHAALDRLGMSPGARPAVRGGDYPHGGVDPAALALGELRTGQPGSPAPGVDHSAFVDPAVTAADTED